MAAEVPAPPPAASRVAWSADTGIMSCGSSAAALASMLATRWKSTFGSGDLVSGVPAAGAASGADAGVAGVGAGGAVAAGCAP